MERKRAKGKSGQSAIEYIILLGGIIIVAVIVILLIRQQVVPSTREQILSGVDNFTRFLGTFGG